MRKRFLATLLCLLSFCTYGFAQKGMHSVGLNVSYNDDIDISNQDFFDLSIGLGDGYRGFSIGAKYQYYLTNYIRLSPTVKYVSMENSQFENSYFYDSDYYQQLGIPSYVTWRHEKVSMQGFDVSLDIHWFFTKVRRIRSYFITGLSVGHLKSKCVADYYDQIWFDWYNQYNATGSFNEATKDNRFGMNVGIGINWEIIPALSLQTEFVFRYDGEDYGDYPVDQETGEEFSSDLYINTDLFRPTQFTIGLSYNF